MFCYWDNDFEIEHIMQDFLYLFTVIYGHFSAGVLNRRCGRICMYSVDAWHIPNDIKQCLECFLK